MHCMRLSTACHVLWTDFTKAQWSGFIVPGVYEAAAGVFSFLESGNETKISAGNVILLCSYHYPHRLVVGGDFEGGVGAVTSCLPFGRAICLVHMGNFTAHSHVVLI